METVISFLENHLLACPIKNSFGFDCPGCGTQRAIIALLRGDILLSLKMNASVIPLILTLVFTSTHLIFGYKNGAKYIVFLFSSTVFIMIAHFVIKLISQH